jgi:DNA-directed RNA polymerase specialized sigma24 family protein
LDNKKTYYVKNKDLLPEIRKYKATKVISDELGSMILQIARNYSNKGNFANYTWKEDMIGDAVLTCVTYLHNFNPDKSKNPFAYITTICHNAFLNFIKKQKKHGDIKDICFKGYQIIMDEAYILKSKGINYAILKK